VARADKLTVVSAVTRRATGPDSLNALAAWALASGGRIPIAMYVAAQDALARGAKVEASFSSTQPGAWFELLVKFPGKKFKCVVRYKGGANAPEDPEGVLRHAGFKRALRYPWWIYAARAEAPRRANPRRR